MMENLLRDIPAAGQDQFITVLEKINANLRKQAAGNWDEVNDREILHHVAEVLHRLAEESREMHRDPHGIEELQHEVEESLEEHLHHPKE